MDVKNILQWDEGAALEIGSFCSIARGVTFILGGNHRTDWITTFPFGHIFADHLGGTDIVGHPSSNGPLKIGHDVWLGDRATVMSGVTIDHGAVIAANAHVVKDVGPYEIWGGNPARKIKDRFDDHTKDLLLRLEWWHLSVDDIKFIAPILSTEPTHETLEFLVSHFRGAAVAALA